MNLSTISSHMMLILPSFSMACCPPPSHVSTASRGALAGHEHCLLTISPSPLLPLYLAASSHLLTQLPKVISEYGISCLWSAAPLCQVKFLTLIYCDCPYPVLMLWLSFLLHSSSKLAFQLTFLIFFPQTWRAIPDNAWVYAVSLTFMSQLCWYPLLKTSQLLFPLRPQEKWGRQCGGDGGDN